MLHSLIGVLMACLAQAPELPTFPAWLTSSAALPTGELLVSLQDGTIVSIDANTGGDRPVLGADPARPSTLIRAKSAYWNLAADPKGELLAAAASHGRIDVLPLIRETEGEQAGNLRAVSKAKFSVTVAGGGARDETSKVIWSKSGSHFATWSPSFLFNRPLRTFQLWTREGEMIWEGPRPFWVSSSPAGDLFALVCQDEYWLVQPGKEPRKFPLKGASSCIGFSPDGKFLAVAGDHSQLWMVQVSDGTTAWKTLIKDLFKLPNLKALSMAWSPNGKWLGVLCGESIDPFIIDVTDGNILWAGGHMGGIMGTVFPSAWTAKNQFLTGVFEVSLVSPPKWEMGDSITGMFETTASHPTWSHTVLVNPFTICGLNNGTSKIAWERKFEKTDDTEEPLVNSHRFR